MSSVPSVDSTVVPIGLAARHLVAEFVTVARVVTLQIQPLRRTPKMRSPAIRTLVCGVILFGFATTGSAQLHSPVAAFTGTGAARIERAPKLMRVIVPVAENAEDVSDALAALTEAAATVRKDLIKLGAAAGHITIGEPDLKAGSGAGNNMFGMMAEMGLGGGVAPEDDGLVTVQLVVTADFTLPEGDIAEILCPSGQPA